MATETHIAGLVLTIAGKHMVQRCAWCGATLLAYDLSRMAVVGEWEEPAHYTVGGLVRFEYDGTVASFGEVALTRTTSYALEDQEKLPDDACAHAIPLEGADD